MKVGELRKIIDKYKKEELTYIIAEMYKAFPKKMLKETVIDFIIENPRKSTKSIKAKKKRIELPDMDDLFDDVSFFCTDAMDQLYFVPNRQISKKERSGWRFTVMKMYKNLLLAGTVDENVQEVGMSLASLYEVLCYGCSYTIFSSDEPFDTIKVPQVKFFEETLRFNNIYLTGNEAIKFNLKILFNPEMVYTSIMSKLMDVALKYFKTQQQINDGIEALVSLINKTKQKKVKTRDSYSLEDKIDKMAEFGFKIYMSNYQKKKAIDFFKNYYESKNKEVKLNILMKLLKEFEEDALIIQEYKLALKEKITPRDYTKEIYHAAQLAENNTLL